jgi:predicted RNase H-like HicB family nuclease
MAKSKRSNSVSAKAKIASQKLVPGHYAYTVRIHRADPDETGYWVDVPALPGCVTQAETYEQALVNADEAIQLYLEGLIEEGLPIPREQSKRPPAKIVMSVRLPAVA